MNRLLSTWRYYSFGKDQYKECMDKVFINNLETLRQTNLIIASFISFFIFFPIFFEMDVINKGLQFGKPLINVLVYVAAALIAFGMSFYLNYKIQTSMVGNKFIFTFATFSFVNLMAFGIYIGFFSNPDKPAALFLCFLVCALLMFIYPPQFSLILTLSAVAAYVIVAIIVKQGLGLWIYEIINVVVAGIICLFFSWHITKLRMGLEISTTLLEEERNKYMDQSTVDELTKLKNRRDFMQTFTRYINNYRTSDDWLCVAISDIDFFKFYNDTYGHPKGDDCLRSVGAAFNKLRDDKNVYVARIGGEEFGILWFEKDATHVDVVVSYMSDLIKEMKVPHEKSKVSEYVTMSMGVYVERCGASHDVKALYDLADKALYAAKEGGRNCAVVSGREIEQYKITPGS